MVLRPNKTFIKSGARLCVGRTRSHWVLVLDDMACMSLGNPGFLRVKGSWLVPQPGDQDIHRKAAGPAVNQGCLGE
jgi:hypothetical protein